VSDVDEERVATRRVGCRVPPAGFEPALDRF
jgi:hypothetical protein